jgi:hypothetical protein
MEVSDELHASAALPRGKSPQYPLYRRLGGPQSRSGRLEEEKILDTTGLELQLLGRVASRYTDCATRAPTLVATLCPYFLPADLLDICISNTKLYVHIHI